MLTPNQRMLMKRWVEEGRPKKQIARALKMCPKTVRRWAARDSPFSLPRTTSPEQAFLREHEDCIRELFKEYGTCAAIQKIILEKHGLEIHPRMLQRFCKAFRPPKKSRKKTK
jgi:transposase